MYLKMYLKVLIIKVFNAENVSECQSVRAGMICLSPDLTVSQYVSADLLFRFNITIYCDFRYDVVLSSIFRLALFSFLSPNATSVCV